MKTFKEFIVESKGKSRIDKVIVKGLERYIVQGSEDGKPWVIANDGKKRIGKDYFKELEADEYFKTEKEAKEYLK